MNSLDVHAPSRAATSPGAPRRAAASRPSSRLRSVPLGVWTAAVAAVAWCSVAGACAGEEAAVVEVPVVVDASGFAPVVTDLGYTVTVSEARAVIGDLGFTTAGEQHAGRTFWGEVAGFVVGRAWAHPGHYAGGEVIGELPGRHVIDWLDDGAPIGTASMLVGRYHGANLAYFDAAASEDGLAIDDPLVGHGLVLVGAATRGDDVVDFTARLSLAGAGPVVGAPLELTLVEGAAVTLGVALTLQEPLEAKTLFDGLDFVALDEDADGVAVIAPGQAAHNALRRAVVAHDFYRVVVR